MIPNTKLKYLIANFIIILILISCQPHRGAKEYSGLGDYTGSYQFMRKNPSSYDCPLNAITFSQNDLVISSDGRFTRKMYALNANNECAVNETLTGKITITHPKKSTPQGIAEYDNSDLVELIILDWMEDGKHDRIIFDSDDGSGLQYFYTRTN